MSACRSSARHLLRQTQSCTSATAPHKRLRLCALSRCFHSTSFKQDAEDGHPSTSATAAAARDDFSKVAPLPPKPARTRPKAEAVIKKRRAERAHEEAHIKETFKPYSAAELDALRTMYSEEQMAALEAAEASVDVDDMAEQWGERLDQWKVDYMDDLAQVDPLVDPKEHMQISDAPQFHYRTELEFEEMTETNANFNGLSLTEMLYIIEKRDFLASEVKAGLRTLHRWKGTHRETAAKRILWRYVPVRYLQSQISNLSLEQKAERNAIDVDSGKLAVEFLFEMLDALPMKDETKKHEMLALKHWCGTPKEESLRPMLMRVINEHNGLEDPAVLNQAHITRLKNLHIKELGFDPSADGNWLVQGRDQELFNRDIFFGAVKPSLPKLRDPRAKYDDAASEDAFGDAYSKLAQKLNVTERHLRSFRVKALVMHRVVNQTRIGKIQSFYVLTVCGNENGLLGIGEGKSAETEDALLLSRMAALRNVQPIVRYENRTIYGKHAAKVGGTTVEIAARPPGFGIRTQSLLFEIARCAGIRDLAGRVGRSRNKMNTVKATVAALMAQKVPEDIARARGRKLVDLRRVYYNRTVY